MALVLIVRMSMQVAKYEELAFEYPNDDFEDDDGMESNVTTIMRKMINTLKDN